MISVKPLQLSNAEEPMLVTLSGIVIPVKPEQALNAEEPMLVTLSGMLILVKPEQASNAPPPMPKVPSFKVSFVFSGISP